MPKRSRQQIAEDEKKILAEIQKNANESIDTIAKHCKFSRQKVWRSIKRLEKDHIIWGYTAIVDDAKQDRKHYVTLIKKTAKPLDEATMSSAASTKIQDMVASEGITIESSFYVHGEYDWIITFTALDMHHAKRFIEVLNKVYEGYIEKIILEETLFWVRRQRIFNPNAKKLREFVF
jgi:DNA-binding Lrp family transcriptional regulator